MGDGIMPMFFVVLAAVAAMAGLMALAVPLLGPVGTAIGAVVIVYLVGLFFTRRLLPETGLRIGSMIGAAAGGWCGAHVYQQVDGVAGVILSAIATGVLVGVGVGIGFMVTCFLIEGAKKKKKA